jgi:hypothetical protein
MGKATHLAVPFNWAEGSSPLQMTMIRIYGVGAKYIHCVLKTREYSHLNLFLMGREEAGPRMSAFQFHSPSDTPNSSNTSRILHREPQNGKP